MFSDLLRSLLLLCLLLAGCSNSMVVTVPPRVDLHAYKTVGLINLEVEPSFPLKAEVTPRFLATTQASQPGVRMLELGALQQVLLSVGHRQLDFQAVRAIGAKYGVDALLSGELTVSPVEPSIALDQISLANFKAEAKVNGGLRAKLQETVSGATVWSNGAHGRYTIAGLRLGTQGAGSFDLTEPGQQYQAMLNNLVKVATQDFRPTYERRRID